MKLAQICLSLCLMLCCAHRSSRACDWMKNRYGLISRESLALLRRMGGELSPMDGPFPQRLYRIMLRSKVGDQMRFLAEATEQIVELFSADTKAAEWDTRALDSFLNILDTRQRKELQHCAKTYPAVRRILSKLRRHFRKLKNILKKTNYSRESWEQIRTVVWFHLVRMNLIAVDVTTKLKG